MGTETDDRADPLGRIAALAGPDLAQMRRVGTPRLGAYWRRHYADEAREMGDDDLATELAAAAAGVAATIAAQQEAARVADGAWRFDFYSSPQDIRDALANQPRLAVRLVRLFARRDALADEAARRKDVG